MARAWTHLFPLLGVTPAAGRLHRERRRPGAAAVAVLRSRVLAASFGAIPRCRRVVTLNPSSTRLSAVAAGIRDPNFDTDIVRAVARHRPARAERGTIFSAWSPACAPPVSSPAQAQAEWTASWLSTPKNSRDQREADRPRFLPLRDELVGDYPRCAAHALAAAGLLLHMCANLAGLLLARGLGPHARRRARRPRAEPR